MPAQGTTIQSATLEMGAAMVVPTLAAIALLAAALVQDAGTLLVIEHAAMFTGMFAVMLARPGEYSRHRGAQQQATA